jgi:hypothetical protein
MHGNPLDITSLRDLARNDVRLVNRQNGSGARLRQCRGLKLRCRRGGAWQLCLPVHIATCAGLA